MIDLKQAALEAARKILAGRLRRANIRAPQPDHFFHCEPGEPRPFPGGLEVRVKVWRHYSDALVKIDDASGDVTGFSLDKFADPPTQTELNRDQAVALLAQILRLPDGAVLESFRNMDFAPGRRLPVLEYVHLHQGILVDGDFLRVAFHPDTRRIVEYDRKWRTPQVG